MEDKRLEILDRIIGSIKKEDSIEDVIHVLIALLGSSMSKLEMEKFEVSTKNEKFTFLIENLNKKGIKLC